MLIGGVEAPGILGGPGVATIADAVRVTITGIERLEADVRVEADVHRDR
jgi:hypothetical protein